MSKDRLILLFGLVTYGMGQSLLYVIFAPLSRQMELLDWQFGVLISASNVAVVIFSPMWGRVSQTAGRKKIFIVGLLGYAVGYGALAFGIQVGLWGWLAPIPLFFMLLGSRFAYGTMASAITPAATAYIADTTDVSNRASGMALVAASGGLGTIVGPAFGVFLSKVGPVVPMYSAAGLAVVAAILAGWKLTEPIRPDNEETGVKVAIFDRRVLPYLVGWFVIFMVFTSIQPITAFLIQDQYGITDVGEITNVSSIALFSMAIVTLVVQIAVMQMWKIQPKVLLRVGFIVFAAVLIFFAYATSLLMLYLSFAGMGLAFALAAPGLNAAASLSVESREQGAVAGLLSAAPSFGMIFGPALGASIYSVAPTAPMIGGAVLSAGVGLMFCFVKVPEPPAASDAASPADA
jgi:MFS family permease